MLSRKDKWKHSLRVPWFAFSLLYSLKEMINEFFSESPSTSEGNLNYASYNKHKNNILEQKKTKKKIHKGKIFPPSPLLKVLFKRSL